MILYGDGFDHYGSGSTGRSNMLLGAWAAVGTNWTPETTKPRNSIHSLKATSSDTTGARKSFGSTKTTVGVAGAFFLTQLPASNTVVAPITLVDQANAAQITVVIQSSGALELKRGDRSTGTSITTTASQVVFAGSWAHIEMKVIAGSTTTSTDGSIVVYVNNTSAISLSANTRTINTSNREYSGVVYGQHADNTILPTYMDDVYGWDTSGSYNNDIPVGDKDVLPYYMDGDEATSDWTRNTGANDYGATNQTAQDGDTTYLEATAAAQVEELSISAVPSSVDGIAAAIAVSCMRKTAAGASEVEVNIVESGGADSGNAAHVLTQSYAYYHNVVERNPVDGTTAWTYTTLSAAKLRLERTV